MKGSEKKFRTDFEDAWREALDGAEMSPGPAAWQRFEGKLVQMEAAKYRKYYLFYRAAAAILLLGVVGSALYFGLPTDKSTDPSGPTIAQTDDAANRPGPTVPSQGDIPTATDQTVGKAEATEPPQYQNAVGAPEKVRPVGADEDGDATTLAQASVVPGEVLQAKDSAEGGLPPADQKREAISPLGENALANRSGSKKQESNTLPPSLSKENEQKTVAIAQKTVAKGEIGQATKLILQENAAPEILAKNIRLQPYQWLMPGLKLPEQLLMAPTDQQAEKEQYTPQLYANLNLNSDFFNPNFSGNSETVAPAFAEDARAFSSVTPSQTDANGVVDQRVNQQIGQENTPQASFTYGLNMGVRLSKRWLLEGGVTYANYNTNTRTSAIVSDYAASEVQPLTLQNSSAKADRRSPYQISGEFGLNNSFEFASVPMTAGYVIGIKKFNFILKAGVSTDFFLRNEISDESNILNTVTMTPGNESPFRSVMFNGLVGNELNYMLNRHYSFSIAANYRFALNSLTKPTEGFSSLPNAYGIGMVFRYHFNN